MKRLLKSILKGAWGKTAVVRRPIVRRLDAHVERVLDRSVRTPVIEAVQASTHATQVLAFDMNLVLNSVVRELARLQLQVEALQQLAEESAADRSHLSVVAPGDDEPCQATA